MSNTESTPVASDISRPSDPSGPASGERVLVAMSGGVDSSAAAAMLVDRGCDVVGVTMKLYDDGSDIPDRPCCSLDSTSDARRVCDKLGIPHYVLNLSDRFRRDVLADFVAEYARGRTPIPCVRCNTFTKFRDLIGKADAIDARWMATGHYARTAMVHGERALLRGVDPAKDQSYFLWGIPRSTIARLVLPIGAMTKPETRAVARRFGLRVSEKVESQDICFVPHGDHTRILAEELGIDAPALAMGPLRLVTGETVGEHQGFARYTIGQRRGLPGGFSEPMYVVDIVPSERAVVIGPREALLGRGVIARELNWLAPPPGVGARVSAQIRHRARAVSATVIGRADDLIEVALEEPVAAITPGQSLVMYDGERILGGGVIASRGRAMLPVFAA